MIVHNITTKPEWAIAEQWLLWQQQEQIPEVMATGLFDRFSLYRLLDQEDSDGPTYTIQYFASSEEKYKTYLTSFASLHEQMAFQKWSDQFVSLQTSMKLVD
jgi:hypothetical protein